MTVDANYKAAMGQICHELLQIGCEIHRLEVQRESLLKDLRKMHADKAREEAANAPLGFTELPKSYGPTLTALSGGRLVVHPYQEGSKDTRGAQGQHGEVGPGRDDGVGQGRGFAYAAGLSTGTED